MENMENMEFKYDGQDGRPPTADEATSPTNIQMQAQMYAQAFRSAYNGPKSTTPTSPSRSDRGPVTGISRILSLSECFAPNPSSTMATVEHWQNVVEKQFTPNANFVLILYSKHTNNRRGFGTFLFGGKLTWLDLKNPALSEFFASLYTGAAPLAECLWTMENPRETVTSSGIAIESSRSSWTLYFMSGAQVVMRGSMSVTCESGPLMRIQAFEFNCLGWREYMPREMWLTYFAKASNQSHGSVTMQHMPPTQFGEYGLPAPAIRALEVAPAATAPNPPNPFYSRSVPSHTGPPEVETRWTGANRSLELQQYQAQLQLQLQLLMQLAAANRESLTVDEQRQILLRIATVTQQIHQVQSQQSQLAGEVTGTTTQPFSPSPHLANGASMANVGSPAAASPHSLQQTPMLQNQLQQKPPVSQRAISAPGELKPPAKKKNPAPSQAKRGKKKRNNSYSTSSSDDEFYPGNSSQSMVSTGSQSSRKKTTTRRAKPVIETSTAEQSPPGIVTALASQVQGNHWLHSPVTDQSTLSPYLQAQQIQQQQLQQHIQQTTQQQIQQQLQQQQMHFQQQQLQTLQQLTPQQLQELQNRQFQLAQMVQMEAKKDSASSLEATLDNNTIAMRNQHLLAQMQQAAAALGTQHKNHIVKAEEPVTRTMSSSSAKTEDVDFAAFLEERPTDNAPTW